MAYPSEPTKPLTTAEITARSRAIQDALRAADTHVIALTAECHALEARLETVRRAHDADREYRAGRLKALTELNQRG